ncbi:MAG: hypothetical protein ACK5HY_16385, partial [Parahaliea sp.]
MTGPTLPLVYAGPILRRVERSRLCLWLATRERLAVRLQLRSGDAGAEQASLSRLIAPDNPEAQWLEAGERLYFLLLDVAFDEPLPADTWIDYRLSLAPEGTPVGDKGAWLAVERLAGGLCYEGRDSPGFILPERVGAVLHGSCRKPHHRGGDGLIVSDNLLKNLLKQGISEQSAVADAPPASAAGSEVEDGGAAGPAAGETRGSWPSALVLTGDQIYADDVAGPLLRRIHTLIALLGLPDEVFADEGSGNMAGIGLASASELYAHPDSYYRRDRLLPRHSRHRALAQILFRGVEKPVFTSVNARNHLITLGEVLVMYLLVWSPVLWQVGELTEPPGLGEEERALYRRESVALAAFAAGLTRVRRLLAHLPVAMIFDDHDVTDDWNLTRGWEEVAYGHPFSP